MRRQYRQLWPIPNTIVNNKSNHHAIRCPLDITHNQYSCMKHAKNFEDGGGNIWWRMVTEIAPNQSSIIQCTVQQSTLIERAIVERHITIKNETWQYTRRSPSMTRWCSMVIFCIIFGWLHQHIGQREMQSSSPTPLSTTPAMHHAIRCPLNITRQ